MLDKAISAGTIVLLAPAIVAVWLAIRSSSATRSAPRLPENAPQSPLIGQAASAPGIADKPSVILTIKPETRAISA